MLKGRIHSGVETFPRWSGKRGVEGSEGLVVLRGKRKAEDVGVVGVGLVGASARSCDRRYWGVT